MNKDLLKEAGFYEEVIRVENGTCPTCDNPKVLTRKDFTDELSWKEFLISGMCQSCQDSVFGSPESNS